MPTTFDIMMAVPFALAVCLILLLVILLRVQAQNRALHAALRRVVTERDKALWVLRCRAVPRERIMTVVSNARPK
jgi:hypothetical protein